MSASFYDILKYAKTGLASPEMTAYDKMRALSMAGGAIKTLTGVPPLSFTGNGKPLISWSMLGNGQQDGTPTPDNIIMPIFCGKLSSSDWTIPITNAGQTQNVYLGQVQTVRRVRKLVLTGEESGWTDATFGGNHFFLSPVLSGGAVIYIGALSTHYMPSNAGGAQRPNNSIRQVIYVAAYSQLSIRDDACTTITDFKTYLQQQYAAGTPVVIWYVLAEPETGIVNEPLAKIGTYADTLDSADAGITIPTANGANTLTVETNLQPSSMTIKYR